MRTPNQFIRDLGNRTKEQKGVFILYSILRLQPETADDADATADAADPKSNE